MSKNPKNNRWLLLIAGTLVAAGVAAGVYFLVLNQSNNPLDTDDEEEVVKDKEDDEDAPVILKTEEEIMSELDEEEEVYYEELVEEDRLKDLPVEVEYKEKVLATPDEIVKAQKNKDDYAVGTDVDYGDDHVYRAEENVIVEEKTESSDDMIHTIVEQMPSFPGGDNALKAYLSNNLRYPPKAEENGIHGRVTCQFVIERDGSITDARVVRGVDPDLDREALRVIKSMPKFYPGHQNGKAVRVRYTMPIIFNLQ